MSYEDFIFMIETKKEHEFSFKDKIYTITYGNDKNGDYIAMGQRYEPVKYYSLKELLNNARIENHYFKEMIEIL